MTEPTDDFLFLAPPPVVEKAGVASRVAACCGALLILGVGTVISFGTVLIAALGMWIFGAVQRRRGRMVGRGATWVAASASAAIAILVGFGLLSARMPAGSFKKLMATSDSASAIAAKKQPPAWLERISPGATARSNAMTPRAGSALSTAFTLWIAVSGVALLATFYGTLGWAGAMLWGLAVRGGWDRPLQVRPA